MHLTLARQFIHTTKFKRAPTFWFWRDQWYEWNSTHYELRSRSRMEKCVFDWLSKSWHPSRLADIRSTLSMMRILQTVDSNHVPFWIGANDGENCDYLTVRNGILRLGTRITLQKHTPRFFDLTSTNYNFDPTSDCPRWNEFLRELWPNDNSSSALLQQWFGYCLLPDTSHQKIMTIIGPPRSGKSTIGKVLRGVLGSQSVASPSIRSLSGPFGLWGLLDKTLAIIPDATLPSPCPALEELLKCISGEDAIDINRKSLPPIIGVSLPTRFVILANEMPAFRDTTGALASRLLRLKTRTSFTGKEDRNLSKRLEIELPGILNWSIVGLRRLRRKGQFTQLAVSNGKPHKNDLVHQIVRDLVDALGMKLPQGIKG